MVDIIEQWKKYRNHKKAVFNPATLFFIFVIVDIIWIYAISKIFNIGTDIAINNGASGLEAFLLSNYNLYIFLFQLIALLASAYLGGGE